MYIESGRTRLYYEVYGCGPLPVLAFHGYGQQAGHWRAVAALLGERVTVYAFDLFYHGRSRLAKADAPLRKTRLAQLLMQFLREQGIERFGLLAFSMGAKFALTLVEALPERVTHLWLVAPDGIRTQPWYALATYPPGMRGVLARAVRRPQPLLRLLDALARRRLVDSGLVRFAQWQLDSREKRLRVYRSWTGFRHLRFNTRQLARLLNQRPTPVTFFLGRHDRVIPPAGLRTFAASLTAAHTVLLDAGHGGLLHDVAAYLRRHPAELRW